MNRNSYLPPRQAWAQGPGRHSPGVPSPLKVGGGGRGPVPNRASPAPQAGSASEYYEDVDPRFADLSPVIEHRPSPPHIHTTNAYESEDIPQGARSPAESEKSTFTSISQRGINPRWNPPPPPPPAFGGRGGYGGPVPARRPVGRVEEVLLTSNPDFEIPSRGGGRRPGGAGMIPGSAYPAL